jgi:hypothetical protein
VATASGPARTPSAPPGAHSFAPGVGRSVQEAKPSPYLRE